jgi:predicted HNH restriction endonuclease
LCPRNRAAWKHFFDSASRNERYRGLTALEVPHQDFDAIDDIGTDTPARTIVRGTRYSRNPEIRAAVMKRAAGKCELCGKLGFYCTDSSRYLESHHIIALADDGADRMTNVIALCADDHREAHFGRRRNEIEKDMIRIVMRLERRRLT